MRFVVYDFHSDLQERVLILQFLLFRQWRNFKLDIWWRVYIIRSHTPRSESYTTNRIA